jgi:hypothetical protein
VGRLDRILIRRRLDNTKQSLVTFWVLARRTHRHLGKAIALLTVLQALNRLGQGKSELLGGLQIMLQQVIGHTACRPDPHARQTFERFYERE